MVSTHRDGQCFPSSTAMTIYTFTVCAPQKRTITADSDYSAAGEYGDWDREHDKDNGSRDTPGAVTAHPVTLDRHPSTFN